MEIFHINNSNFKYVIDDKENLKNLYYNEYFKKPERHVFQNSAIFMVRTISDAIKLYMTFEFPIWVQPRKFRFLLFVEEIVSPSQLLKIPRARITRDSRHLSHFSYYAIETKKKIQLFTIDLFREGACGSYDYVEIGSFDRKLRKWEKFRIEEKYTNFHNCLIVWDSIIKNQVAIHSFLKTVSKKANFTYFVQSINKDIHKDGMVLQEQAVLTFVPLHAANFDRFWVTSTFGEAVYVFYLTPGEKYSSYEKMVLPFDIETWTYLGITFGVAFGVIFVIQFLPARVRQVIAGSLVQHPGYNVLGTFFGIGQVCRKK